MIPENPSSHRPASVQSPGVRSHPAAPEIVPIQLRLHTWKFAVLGIPFDLRMYSSSSRRLIIPTTHHYEPAPSQPVSPPRHRHANVTARLTKSPRSDSLASTPTTHRPPHIWWSDLGSFHLVTQTQISGYQLYAVEKWYDLSFLSCFKCSAIAGSLSERVSSRRSLSLPVTLSTRWIPNYFCASRPNLSRYLSRSSNPRTACPRAKPKPSLTMQSVP